MIVLKYIFLLIVGGGFQLSYGVDLKCEFYQDSDVYLCENIEIQNKNNDVKITSYTGRHSPGKKDTDVEMISIHSTPLKYIPENIGSLFSLTKLRLFDTQLVKIKAADFVGMENLEYLDLSQNRLKSLNIATFAKLTKLKSIKLNQNNLTELDNGLFSNNIKLTYINFEYNNIKYIGNTLFDSLTELNFLSFLRNICMNVVYEQDEDFKLLKEDIEILCKNEDEEKFRKMRKEIQL
ncbi:unnamed protein product [Diamesa hyperborea]